MSKPSLYKISFLNAGRVYELYAGRVASGALWGFIEVSEINFEVKEGLVIDPTEERLRDEFRDTRVLHLPMQSVVRVEEVARRGQLKIRDVASGEQVVTPFPMPPKKA